MRAQWAVPPLREQRARARQPARGHTHSCTIARLASALPCPARPPAADNIIRKQAEDALGILERENFVRGGRQHARWR